MKHGLHCSIHKEGELLMVSLRQRVSVVALSAALAGAVSPSAFAQDALVGGSGDRAESSGVLGGRTYTYTVQDKKLIDGAYIDKSQRIGDCTVVTKGGTCTISTGMAATRTIQLALGAERDNISSQLSISASTTQSVTVGCTSPPLAAGGVWTAWAKGNLWQYKINKWVHEKGADGVDYDGGTSGPLRAFDPSGTRIACG